MALSFKKTLLSLSFAGLAASAILPLAATSASAAELKLGLYADISTLDPHFNNIAPNISLSSHLFDALVNVDPTGKLTRRQVQRRLRFHGRRRGIFTGSPGHADQQPRTVHQLYQANHR